MIVPFLLSDLDVRHTDQDWGIPRANQSVTGKPLSIGGRTFETGLGTHSFSELAVDLNGGAERLTAWVGVDDAAANGGSVRFHVVGDGRLLWSSPRLFRGGAAYPANVDLRGVSTLVLMVDDAGDGGSNDHADWADARIGMIRGSPVALREHPDRKGGLVNGKRWFDTDGRQIQAHGGGILVQGDTYYWYGEERTHGYFNKVGVSCYSSKDLVNWKNEGVVLPSSGFPELFRDKGVSERPKVVFNRRTGKYVMWTHLDANGYAVSEAGIAVADSATGPFRFTSRFRPIPTSTFRDMNLFVDDDGSAYAFYAGEDNATLHVVRLNGEYTAPETPMVEGRTWARVLVGKWREAPAPFKYRGRYYMVTSGCTGWDPNPADLAVADHPLGPYNQLGNPCVGAGGDKTFGGQSTHVFQPIGSKDGEFVLMLDRWKREDLSDARYVWLPFRIPSSGPVRIEWSETPSGYLPLRSDGDRHRLQKRP